MVETKLDKLMSLDNFFVNRSSKQRCVGKFGGTDIFIRCDFDDIVSVIETCSNSILKIKTTFTSSCDDFNVGCKTCTPPLYSVVYSVE